MGYRRRKSFNKLSFGAAILVVLLLPTVYFYLKNPRRVKAAPWPQAAGSWLSRKQISLVNNSGATLHSNTTYTITFNTKSIYDQGYLKTNCDDLRVFYQPSDTNSVDLYRHALPPTGYTCATSTTTKISFPLQADISNGSTDSNYYIYYNNSSASAYSDADALKAYNVGAKTATFMAPFNGSTTALAAGSGTPTTETGAIRYSGTKSALKFDGNSDYVNAGDVGTGIKTVEFWVYPNSTTNYLIDLNGSAYISVSSGTISATGFTDPAIYVNGASSSTLSAGSWQHVAVVTATAIDASAVYLGKISSDYFNGAIDELRLSSIVRYSAAFTPATTPFVRDEFTKLLLHFDENGDDPRNTGKAIDDSGNANHGTIAGAKYVAGLIGVDTSTTDTGYQFNQTYGGHEGIFIEEGTTNKITNPSFEHGTYNTNWTNGGNSFEVFSPGGQAFSKRNAPGPFTSAPIIQGDPANANSLTDDILSFSREKQIGSNFYSNFDTNQGSVALWWTPEYAYNGLSGSGLHYLWYVNSGYYLAYDYANDRYQLGIGGQSMTVSSQIAAGTTYGLLARWDTRNTIDGTNYAGFSINDSATYGITSQPTVSAPAEKIYIGSNGSTGASSGIIEGLTVYRRVLYDGTNGINASTGTDEAAVVKLTSGSDPTIITGSWDVVFCMPTNSSVGALIPGIGNAWSHPYGSNLLPGNSNLGGFMLNGTYTDDGWADEGSPTAVAALASSEKIFSGGYKVTSDAADEGIYDEISVTSGQDFVVRAVAHSDGTSIPKIVITGADDAAIASFSGTTTSTRTSPDYLFFTFEADATENIKVKLINSDSTSGHITYWHQIEVLNNKIDNPSLEGGSSDPWLPTAWANSEAGSLGAGDTLEELITVHSGRSAIEFTSGASATEEIKNQHTTYAKNKFYSLGGFLYGNGTAGLKIETIYETRGVLQTSLNTAFSVTNTSASWIHKSGIFRSVYDLHAYPVIEGAAANNLFADDIYAFLLSDINLIVISADLTNSTETNGLRVDGRDTAVQTITGLTTTSGTIKFKYNPRHSAADAIKFIEVTDAYIAEFVGSGNDYIRVYWSAANTITLAYSMDGTASSTTWSATGAIVAGTTYEFQIDYTGSSTMTLKVDSSTKITLSSIPASFGTAPYLAFWGSRREGDRQSDALFSAAASGSTYDSNSIIFNQYLIKRNGSSAGPFGSGVLFQGDPANANSLTDDLLSFNRGKQIYGNFYSNLDTNQGSVVLWWTPEYAYNSLSGSGLHYLWYINSNYYLAYDYANDRFEQKIGGQSVTSSSNVAAGTGYSLITTWDTKNVLSGSNYQCLIIDNGTPTCGTTQPTVSEPATSIYIGSDGSTGSANGLVEGLTIYRRPLYDGTNGIDVGDGDEIDQIAGATDKDSVSVTGSWDVVFALPTNSTTGTTTGYMSLSSGTSEAWSHPFSSNLLGGTNGTYGFMMNGTYTSDGWADEGTPASVSALYTEEKVYGGGYLVTSDAVNEGIYRDITVTAGKDLVIRAVAHSDGTASPSAVLYDQTNGAEIGRLSATTAAVTRSNPAALIFSGEAPSGCTTVRVKLINTISSGTTYWHSVEVLSNLFTNPSLENGTGNPWIPTGWTNGGLEADEGVQQLTNIHSGLSAFKITYTAGSSWYEGITSSAISKSAGTFFSLGFYKYDYGTYTYPPYARSNYSSGSPLQYVSCDISNVNDCVFSFGNSNNPSYWKRYNTVIRSLNTTNMTVNFQSGANGNTTSDWDDLYLFLLDSVNIAVIPSSNISSVESDKIRVDGMGTYVNTLPSLTTSSGTITFDYTPRHSAADVAKFGNTTPYIAKFVANTSDYIALYWSAANTIKLEYYMGGTTSSTTWSATGAIVAGTTYRMVISYTGSGNMTFSVDGSTKITLSSIPAAFNAAPSTAYWGSNSDGTSQNDAYFVPEFVTPTENTSAPYYKFGSKSAKLANTTAGDGRGYVISINPGNTNTQILSAYVYDGTSGNIGGTVSSSIAKLVFNGSVVTPSAYTDTGGGWWRLSYSAAGVNAAGNYGVSVLSGKTIYVDGIQLEEKAYTTTYTDGTLGTSYAWTGTANESTSSRTEGDLRYSTTSNINNDAGTISLWYRPNWSSGISTKADFILTNSYHASDNLVIAYTDSSDKFYFSKKEAVYVSSTLTKGNWYFITASWDANKVYLSVNGAEATSADRSANNLPSTFAIGNNVNWTGLDAGISVADLKIYSSKLTDTETADLYYSGLGSHKEGVEIEQFTDGEPPISVWHLDENTGTTINDSMSANDGTLASGDATPTWVTGTNCIEDSCLQFDGTDDYASITNSISGIKTLSFWVKPSAATTSVFDLNGIQTVTITDNVIAANSFTSPTIYVNGIETTTVPTDTWSQVVITTSTAIGASSFTFGEVSSSYFSGYLDEIKVFPYVITSTQINKEVNVGSAVVMGGGAGTAQITPIKSKLVGYWKFDEGYGAIAHDSVGSNDGTFGANTAAPAWTNDGKFGKALSFDGADDYVEIADNTLNDEWTISVWARPLNPNQFQGLLGSSGTGNYINLESDRFHYRGTNSHYTSLTQDFKWHHFVLKRSAGGTVYLFVDGMQKDSYADSDTSMEVDEIGRFWGSSDYTFEGGIDELKVYSYELSADEIKQDYNYGSALKFATFSDTSNLTGGSVASSSASAAYCIPGDTATCNPPVAEWNFEEGSGQTVNDISGNANAGTLGASSSYENDDPAWVSGKNGKGINLDGTDDYVNIGSQSDLNVVNEFTISAWIKTTFYSPDNWVGIVSKGDLEMAEDTSKYLLGLREGEICGLYSGFVINICSTSRVDDGNWHFVVLTISVSNDEMRIFIDGKKESERTAPSKSVDTSDTKIGRNRIYFDDNYFKGYLDDIRIFNYARTPAQIAWDYNRGKAIAHYKFDECSGTTLHSSNDSYNASLNGTLTVGGQGTQDGAGNCSDGDTSNTWYNGRIGKYNSSLSFDGTDDYVGIGSTLSYVKTLSFWAKPSSTTQKIMELSASDSVEISSGAVSVTGFGTETVYVDGKATSVFPDTNWHQVTIVSDSDITANTINIGKVSTAYYSGQIDDVQIFNYALTGSQAKILFNQGAGVRFGPNTGSE